MSIIVFLVNAPLREHLLPIAEHVMLTILQGVSSLSLNSGSINLTFTAKKDLKFRQEVVSQGKAFSLPYVTPFPQFLSVTYVQLPFPIHRHIADHQRRK
jgi:hypothetical protein